MLDLYPCRLGSLTSLGHCNYTMRPCPQCPGSFAYCVVCEAPEVCPGCRHAERLAQIAAGEVVFPEALGDHGERHDTTAVAILRADLDVDQAGELAHGTEAALTTDQAVMLDAGDAAVYNPGMLRIVEVAPGLGDAAMASPVYVLVLPVVSHDLGHVLQALAPVLTGNGAHNGHMPQTTAGPPAIPRIPRKTYLSDKQCPHGHTYQDSGKALRFRGNNMCTQCAAQAKPRRQAASTAATTEG